MRKQLAMKKIALLILGALATTTGVALAPTAHAWPFCGTFSLFSDDQCSAIEYCLNNDDPACDTALNQQPNSAPRQ
jgi:hypothetical protein